MAARLNVIGVVDTGTEQFSQVQIIVRHEVATVSRSGTVLATRNGVTAVEQPDTRAWTIHFDDGSSWSASMPARKKGCGCS